ncbi:TorF family putative porin [Sphingomonas sp. RS2018]
MKFQLFATAALAVVLSSTGATAQDTAPPKPITVSGSVAVVSDYRFRGVSQSDEEIAVQGGFTVTHESGAYIATWGSNLGGWGTFGGPNLELDLIAGYKFPVSEGGALDVGVTWYTYPGGADNTDFFEPYAKLSGTVGPVSALAGVAYAPKQEALGNFSATPQSRGQSEDNLYLWGDFSSALPSTPLTLKAHIGYSDGNPGLGPNGTSVAPTGKYWDWSLGADVALGPIVLGAAYVDTDISRSESAYLLPNFSSTKDGGPIAGPQVVFSITAPF